MKYFNEIKQIFSLFLHYSLREEWVSLNGGQILIAYFHVSYHKNNLKGPLFLWKTWLFWLNCKIVKFLLLSPFISEGILESTPTQGLAKWRAKTSLWVSCKLCIKQVPRLFPKLQKLVADFIVFMATKNCNYVGQYFSNGERGKS